MGRNSEKDPNRPKRPQSAYFIFMGDLREKCKRTGEADTSNVTEFTKLASMKWKALAEEDPEERQGYQNRADTDKARYEREMATYQPPPGMSGKSSRKKQKDPYAPKRPKSGYLFFLDEFRAENKHQYDHKEIVSHGAAQWAKMSDEQKKKYQELHEQDKDRYSKQVASMGSY